MTLDHIIAQAGGVTALASKLGLDHSAVSKWRRKNSIPVERVFDVERVTGIPRHVIRPDLWDAPAKNMAGDQ